MAVLTLLLLFTAQQPILFDTDSGFFNDDGASLVMALRSPDRVSVQAITVVSGNVWARQGAEYMFHILRLLRRPGVPLYIGAEAPLVHTAAMSKHEGPLEFAGALALSPTEVKPPFGGRFAGLKAQPRNAVDFMVEAIERSPGRITVLALGPMTNLALALRLRPAIETQISQLVFMGGNVGVPGNTTRAAEFNFWFDPEAAQIVLRSRIPRKVMFPLDICNRALITRALFEEIIAVRTPVTELYREDMGHVYPGFFRNREATRPLWDELATAWLIDPRFVTRSETTHLDVDTRFGPSYGAVIPLDRKLAPEATPIEVMLDLDFSRLFRLYKHLLTRVER